MDQKQPAAEAANIISKSTLGFTEEDLQILSPKEQEVERKAVEEELKKRHWMADPARSVARRVAVSVFALGDLATGQ